MFFKSAFPNNSFVATVFQVSKIAFNHLLIAKIAEHVR